MNGVLSAIWIYPIKSLDGVRVETSGFAPSGGLLHDRQWALFDEQGDVINGKREPRVHHIRTAFSPDFASVTLNSELTGQQTIALDDLAALSAWFTNFFNDRVEVRRNDHSGFPDDLDSPGPTLISEASLAEIASWFPGITAENIRGRLRPNLIISGVPAFSEDHLFGPPGVRVPFSIGPVRFLGNNPCQRCIVPARDPQTGQMWPMFQKQFTRHREATLPDGAEISRFNHFYRAALNTLVETTNTGATIAMGDQLACDQLS